MQTQPGTADIAGNLDELCALFDEELERQEIVLANCRAQGEAARLHDLDYLDARTQSLGLLMEDALQAETTRIELLGFFVDHYALPVERQTLTHLIEVAPQPWRRRLSEFQLNIRKTLDEIREVVRENARYMRGTLRLIDKGLNVATGGARLPAGGYTAEGAAPSGNVPEPALIDAQG